MIRQLYFLLICLGLGPSAFAQYPDIVTDDTVTVYPVRINHKVGFVEIFPNNKAYEYIPPIYDFIAELNAAWHTPIPSKQLSTYRIFERDEKVGLLDDALNPVLPNRFKRIRVLAPNFFAVEQDSLFVLIDSTQNEFLSGQHYEDIYLADTIPGQGNYFFVKKQNRWGLSRQDGTTLLAPQFTSIQSAGLAGFYKVKRKARSSTWELIDSIGRQIIPDPAHDILMLDRTFIALKDEFFWHTHYINLKPKAGEKKHETNKVKYLKIEKISKYLAAFALQAAPEVQLWHITKRKILQTLARENRKHKKGVYFTENRNDKEWFPWWFPLDDEYAVFNRKSKPKQEVDFLIDTSGQVKSPQFDYIMPSGKAGVYRVSQKRKWGLYAAKIKKGVLIPCDYDGINPFVGDIAFCQRGIGAKNRKYGAIGLQNNNFDLLIPKYNKIEQLDSRSVYVPDQSNEVTFGLDEEGKFRIDSIYENTFSLRLNKNRNRREVKIIPKTPPKDYPLVSEEKGRFTSRRGRKGFSIIKTKKQVSGIGAPQEGEVVTVLPYAPPGVFQIVIGEMLGIYRKDQAIHNTFTQNTLGAPYLPLGFLSLKEQRFVEEKPIIGMRPFDNQHQHTAFIRTDGTMGLINRAGQPMQREGKEVSFTYIGPFRAGRARVCIGGTLKAIEDKAGMKLEEPARFILGKTTDFMREFQMMMADTKTSHHRTNAQLFVSSKTDSASWAFINTEGKIVLTPTADYLLDFDWEDKSALVLRKNGQTDLYGHPDADFGVIDFEGNEIIPTQYDEINMYANYYIIGQRGTPTFTFNKKGHQIFVNPTKPSPFKEGYSLFQNEDRLWGYIDTAGNIVIPPRFTLARPFSEGLAMVVDSTGHCGFINTQGETVITTTIKERLQSFIGDFREGLCWWTTNGRKWHCYDRNGQKAFQKGAFFAAEGIKTKQGQPLIHYELNPLPMDFSNGLSVIQSPDTITGKPSPAAIDKQGKMVIKPGKFASISSYNTLGVAVFSLEKGGLQGLLDKEGKVLIPPSYKKIMPFTEGYAKVSGSNGRYGLIDAAGKEVLSTEFGRITAVSEGIVAVQTPTSRSWQFLQIQTQKPIGDTYDKVQAFKNGVTFVAKKEQKIIINNLGEELTLKSGEPQFFSEGIFGVEGGYLKKTAFYADASGNNLFGQVYNEIDTFHLGIAKVRPATTKKRLYGAINTRGVYIVPPKFRFLHPQPDGNIIINPQIFYGLINKKGEILLEPEFDRIEQLKTPNLFRAERGEEMGYFRVMGDKVKWIWELQK